MSKVKMLQAVQPFIAQTPGVGRQRVTVGTLFGVGDPLTVGHEAALVEVEVEAPPEPEAATGWVPVSPHAPPCGPGLCRCDGDREEVVERATAAPGEKRITPKKKAAKDAGK